MKKLFEKLKKPNTVFAIIFSVITLMIVGFTITWIALGKEGFLNYVLYVLSAITFSYFVYIIVYCAPRFKNGIIGTMKKHKFTNELLASYGYRSVIFLMCSFTINIVYALFHAVIAVLARSVWYGALATYYIAISLIRGGIIAISRKKKSDKFSLQRQVRAYRNCGIYLVLLNFVFICAIMQMILREGGFQYAGLMIYVMATYTFYKLGLSIYNLFKAKKHNDYTVQSIKNISFADALVSLLALQTALLATFAGSGYQPYLPNSLTGGTVSFIIIGIGVYMIVKGQKKMKELETANKEGQKKLKVNEDGCLNESNYSNNEVCVEDMDKKDTKSDICLHWKIKSL